MVETRFPVTGNHCSSHWKTNFYNDIIHNIITSATGNGKTYIACSFGIEACKHYYTVTYVRMSDLLIDLKSTKDDGRFTDVLKKYTNPTQLILDA